MSMFKAKREEAASQSRAESTAKQPTPRARSRPLTRLNLARGADGRIRQADSTDIGDIWAEQNRIRLREAIEEDKRLAEKKKKRAENGLFGLKRAKSVLPKAKVAARPKPKPKLAKKPADISPSAGAKEVVVSLSIPKIHMPKLPPLPRTLPFKVTRKRLLIGSGVVLVAVLLFVGSFSLYPTSDADKKAKPKGVASESIKGGSPSYDTILPKGKDIQELGGWARVSPPDKEPVYAYADKIDDATITVSQQPLPKAFKPDVATHIEELAKQFTANEKITTGDITAYIGTSIKGPQSVIFAKGDLLILIKSTAKLTNEQWSTYLDSLE